MSDSLIGKRPKALFVLNHSAYDLIYPPMIREQIDQLADVIAEPLSAEQAREQKQLLEHVEVLLSGWGAPILDEELLQAMPNLKAVLYGAGSIRSMVTEAFWQRNLLITSAYAANAVPVAEFALSQILFSLKNGWSLARTVREQRAYPPAEVRNQVAGAFHSTVGIVSLGMIGKLLCKLLEPFDVRIIAYDPFMSKEDAASYDVELVELDEVFRRSDVVSLHAPWLKETEGMITGEHFAVMKQGATFINTARGAIVREDEMIEVLRERPDLQAVLDVTHPEPPVTDSPLYDLPNVVLTPHVAGSMSRECARMGSYVVRELEHLLQGQAPVWGISQEQARVMA